MANLSGFNAAEVEPNTGFDPIPAGEYEVCIVASDMRPTKAGDGQYLNLELQVLTGQYQNRKLFDKLNLQNPNDEAVQIARGTLSSICRAVGVLEPSDSSELHNKAMRAKVVIEKRKDNGEFKNTIKGYKPRLASPVPQMATAAPGGAMVTGQPKAPWAT